MIIACNAAPARCSVAAMVASRSPVARQHLDGQLLQPPVTLGPLTTTLRVRLGCCQPGCVPHRLLAHNRFPYRQRLTLLRHFRWPSGHHPKTLESLMVGGLEGVDCASFQIGCRDDEARLGGSRSRGGHNNAFVK